VASYLLEFYLPRAASRSAATISARIDDEAGRLSREGAAVRLVQALCIPDDELFQCLVDAPSVAVAALLAQRAGLPADAHPEAVELVRLPHPRVRGRDR
jgi:hypothetical protein